MAAQPLSKKIFCFLNIPVHAGLVKPSSQYVTETFNANFIPDDRSMEKYAL